MKINFINGMSAGLGLFLFCLPCSAKHFWIAGHDSGVYAAKFDSELGQVQQISVVEPDINAYFIARHPNKNILYIAERTTDSSKIHSYKINTNGSLSRITISDGHPRGIAHISVDPHGLYLAAAYYTSSVTGIYKIDKTTHSLSIINETKHLGSSVHARQKASHPHWSGFSLSKPLVYFTDLGADKLYTYQVNAQTNTVTLIDSVQAPAGSGPRHMAISDDLQFAFVSDELAARVSRYKVTNEGKLSYQDSTLTHPELKSEPWFNASDIRLHPNNHFLYMVNRGFDRVSVFTVEPKSAKLTFVEHEPVRGSISRHINFDPSGKWALVLGKATHTLSVFKINEKTGELTFHKPTYFIESPMALTF